MTSIKYRADIDGLRSIAVLAVILFHAKIPGFSGGYLGVDVFFVISGFLITGILISDDQYNITKFYDRRVRRIGPALLFMLIATAPFCYFWMFSSQYGGYSDSLRGTLFFYSNIVFYGQAGYFQEAVDLAPLIHTWSLAVEEQFYFIYPLFLFATFRIKGNARLWLTILAFLVSLAISQWGAFHAQSANFFLLPSRAWELLAGAISALYLRNETKPVSNPLSLLGAGLIVGSIALFTPTTPSPSLYTLLPVGGTVLMLHFGDLKTWTGRFLSQRVFVGIGLISYSIYLWHQPLFALARLRSVTPPTVATYLLLILAAGALATISWYLVEQPNRRADGSFRSRIFYPLIVAASIGLIAFSFLPNASIYTSLEAKRYSAFIDYPQSAQFREQYAADRCFVVGSIEKYDRTSCLVPNPQKRNVLLLGDSHAAHVAGALRRSLKKNDHLLQATFAKCSASPFQDALSYCTAELSFIHGKLLRSGQIDTVILSHRWDAVSLTKLSVLVRRLKHQARRVIVIGPTPEFKIPVPMVLARAAERSTLPLDEILYHFKDMSFSQHDVKFRSAVEQAGGEFIDPISILCREKKCRAIADDGTPMYFDTDHFTKGGAETFLRLLTNNIDRHAGEIIEAK